MPFRPIHGIFQVIVAQALDGLSEADGLFGGPDAVGVEAHRIGGEVVGQRAVRFQLVIRMENARLHLMGGEAEAAFQAFGVGQHLVYGANFALARARIGVAEETVSGKRNAVAQTAAEDLRDRHSPCLAEDIEAGEFECGEDLGAIVVQRRGGIGDEEAHLLQPRRVVTHQALLHGAENGFGRFSAATHLAQAHQAVVGLDFDNGSDEAPPVAPVGMAQRRLQRHGDRGGPDIRDFHIWFHDTTISYLGGFRRFQTVLVGKPRHAHSPLEMAETYG